MSFESENKEGRELSDKLLMSAGSSLNRAVRELMSKKRDDYYLNACIQHTFHSLALILKAKLALIHPILIHHDININLSKKEEEEYRTVSFDVSITRLQNCKISFSEKDENNESFLTKLKEYRNQIEHYFFVPVEKDVEEKLAKVFIFAQYFIRENLNNSLQRLLGTEEFIFLREFAHDYERKIKEIESKVRDRFQGVDTENIIREFCPKCGENCYYFTEEMKGEKTTCYFCGRTGTIDDCHQCKGATIGDMCGDCWKEYFEVEFPRKSG
ncbi:MAG: hypothetical protein IPL83_07520 [Bdellovibrionales bacterium]|nr:hypothetical protein [Bdellovibrionales bacterium]